MSRVEANATQVLSGQVVSVGAIVCKQEDAFDEKPAQRVADRAHAHAHKEEFTPPKLCGDRPFEGHIGPTKRSRKVV